MKLSAIRITLCSALCALLVSCGGSSGSPSTSTGVLQPGVQTSPDDNLPPNDGPVSSSTGHFPFTISDAVIAKNTERWNSYFALQIETALAPLNNVQGLLDTQIPVTYDECGIVNAFYDPFARAITICDELVETLLEYWNGRSDSTIQSVNFILYHEIGHALVDILRLPITGNEESAADSFATVLSGETGRALGSVVGGVFLAVDSSSFGDEHLNGEDRSGDIICWAIGSDPSLLEIPSLSSIVQPFTEAGRDCATEYERQNRSVLLTVPALNAIEVSPVTNPDVIALSDPNPPKTNSTFVPSATLIPLLQTPGESAVWICDAQSHINPVIYDFTDEAGFFSETNTTSIPLPYNVRESAANTVALNYTTFNLVETLSDIQFAGNASFTAVSDIEGDLSCERGNF